MSRTMLLRIFTACVLSMAYVHQGCGKHILVLPLPYFSHTRNMMNVVHHVTETYGHTATVVTSTKLASKFKLRPSPSVDIVISAAFDQVDFESDESKLAKEVCNSGFVAKADSLKQFNFGKICDDFHKDTSLFNRLKHRQLDLSIVDNVPMAECLAAFVYKLSLPYIFFGVLYDPVRMRIPFSPASISSYHHSALTDKMTFSERMYNVFISVTLEIAPNYLWPVTNIAKYTSNKPPITASQLISKASFHLVTTDFLIDYSKPSLAHVAFVGGISTQPSKPLSQRYETFMDSSQGVVIVSFGSGCAGFLNERIDTFVEAFKRSTELNFIVKYGMSELIDGNIMFTPWIPQNDLLGHPKTVAFITHCGTSGQFEALYHGIPMIGIPLCRDQFYNCKRMKQKGYGVVLEYCLLTVNNIVKALSDVTTQKSYIHNIKNASLIFRGRSESPVQRASYWVDHIAIYGDKFLHSYLVDMPWYQYYLFDVFMVVGLVSSTVIYFVAVICTKLKRIVCQPTDKRISQKKKVN